MTFIKNRREGFSLNKFSIIGVIPLVLGVIWLIILYNQIVNLDHEVSAMKNEVKKVEASTAELKEQVFAFFDTSDLESLKSERGLVEERKPEYFDLNAQWAIATQY